MKPLRVALGFALVAIAPACSTTAPTAPRHFVPTKSADLLPGQQCVTELNGRTSLGDCDLESGERGFLVSAG